ncbi:FAD-dependent monooxygenase [Phytoactinopolyspora limicola]|uniref:FAD-dependent monooxygenase n=1 Tax=Phytoactinopolyspora limicola TaxID=2715536 RepID=UPI00140862E0|nr:FAD-dependent monooxygenase [Phytoactinopolyspora limicola]
MTNPKILISGASVAGPTAAYWLGRYGFDVTVVEKAPALRGGGYAVDFRGEAHMTVLERMGVLDHLRHLDTGGTAMSFVDVSGREHFALPPEFAGGDLEVLRADLSRVLHEHSRERANYLFGDSITTLHDTGDSVHATFEHAPDDTFDLVIGADGLHSQVRRLAFTPSVDVVRHLGYYLAGWEMDNRIGVGRTTLMCNVPGRLASVAADHHDPSRAHTLFAFTSPPLDGVRGDTERQKQILRDTFGELAWHVPALLDGLSNTPELYFDSISRVDIEPWTRGRVALLGDAAHGATLGGMGTGSAIVGAYILAGELADADGDHQRAFSRYEERIRPYATRGQDGGRRAGEFLAPSSPIRLAMRNRMLSTRLARWLLMKASAAISDNITLDDYPARHPGNVGSA